jgi:putative transposase
MPWFGARGLRRVLRPEFPGVGRRHIGTLLHRMGLAAMAPQPGTSRRHRGHPVFPYLLRHRTITRPNEVWAMDITYIPMPRGFVYLAAVMDWASRRVLSWRVSITLDSAFCIAAVEDAIARYGCPTIQISLDGQGCWRDNIFVERLWRSLKYEEVYLHAYDSVSAATTGIGRYFTLYNTRRPHSSLADRTPDDAYFFPLPLAVAA